MGIVAVSLDFVRVEIHKNAEKPYFEDRGDPCHYYNYDRYCLKYLLVFEQLCSISEDFQYSDERDKHF